MIKTKRKINMVDYSDCFEGISGGAIFIILKIKNIIYITKN